MIRTLGSTIWYGTDKGAIKKDEKWHYYNGKRWLPDNKVNDILPITPETVWIATPQGINQIRLVEMTLEDKARVFEERIQKRHFRHGLVARSRLTIAGDLASNKGSHTANDGLWTAIYLAAQSFRYAATKDPVAKKVLKMHLWPWNVLKSYRYSWISGANDCRSGRRGRQNKLEVFSRQKVEMAWGHQFRRDDRTYVCLSDFPRTCCR